MDIFNRGPGYFTGTSSSVGKMESARRSGALSGMSMSGSPMDPDRRVGFHNRPKKAKFEQPEEIEIPLKVINIQGL